MSKVVFDGVGEQPELNRITAKKNYASSSQSHKMGATAMFNDILHHLAKEKYPELLNEVGGLVAVRQHPVYAFQKIPIEGTDQYTHKFIGLFTVGADKGDKNFFGFSDAGIKKTAIRLEGVDHIKGVGFNYPWEVNGVKKIRYNAAKEALCIVTDSDPTKWIAIFEQSMAGVAETEAEIDAYLAKKWQPAFECAYYNNPLIVGVDMTLAEINANIEAFGNLRRNDDRPYSMCEFWIDGEYDVYYLDKETNRYEKNGINILTDLGITEGEIAGLTIEEKNALFIQKRVERFREQAKEYFNVTDSIYQLMFLFIILATDNFEKNMYPYLMALLWRFLQDDLDSIFSTDNQGLDTKKYSTELHDFTDNSKSAYVFKGEDSAFWQLIELAFPNECKQMGRDILQAMYDKASGGTTTTEKLLCFFDDYFFDRAQNYFTPSAYNDDTEYAYEEAWNNKGYVSSVDIHPLAQALGSHESTERAWLEKRIIYLQSKFSFGSFASSGSDLGVISFRTQQAQSFTLTPAIDCYPTIVSGDGNVINAKQRVMAGESVTLEGAGGSNTNVYIVGADWLSDIGDLKGLALDPSAVQKLSISSKRLRRIKVGDEVASEVTSALQQLDIQRCDCLETIDARNLTSLLGVVDLSKCPRLSEAYFGGSSASAIVIAAGSKIEKLELPDTISVLDLRDAKFLQEINVGKLANLNSLRLEGVPSLDGFEVLSNAYNAEGQKLQSIRLIGFTRNGTSDDLDMLSNLANDKDKDGNEHPYNGIDAQGKPTDGYPVLEGTLNIDGYVYEDAAEVVKAAFPSIVFTPKGFYVRFADPEVQRIVASNWGDGTGITTEQVKAITDVDNKFSGNTLIETFDEFERFEGVTTLGNNAFKDCNSLTHINLKNIVLPLTSYGTNIFENCSSLETIGEISKLESIPANTFAGCVNLKGELLFDSVEKVWPGNFIGCKVTKLKFPELTTFGGYPMGHQILCGDCEDLVEIRLPKLLIFDGTQNNRNFIYNCPKLELLDVSSLTSFRRGFLLDVPSLKTIIFDAEKITSVDANAFTGCSEWEVDNLIFPNVEGVIGLNAFNGCSKIKSITIGDYCTEIQGGAFAHCASLEKTDIGKGLVSIGTHVWIGVNDVLKTLIIRAELPPTINNFSLNGTSSCPIYVPDASVEAYQSATNWVNYKDRIKSMFYYLGYIDFVDPAVRDICVANFDTDGDGKIAMEEAAAVTDIGTIFQNNTSITKFNELEYFKNVTELAAYAFYESSLSDINLNNISSLKGHTFRTCKNLRKLVFKNCVSITGFIAFYSNVETVIFKNGWIDNNLGYNFSSSKLTSLVVCGDTISSLHTTDLENTPIASGAGYIYVPDNLVNDYKAATNWNAYASQIKPLSEYDGELP